MLQIQHVDSMKCFAGICNLLAEAHIAHPFVLVIVEWHLLAHIKVEIWYPYQEKTPALQSLIIGTQLERAGSP